MEDLTLEFYNHDIHFPFFWPIYSRYWREVNGESLEEMTNYERDGKVYVTTRLEQKLATVYAEKKLKMAVQGGEIVGFIQYQPVENNTLFVCGLYTLPEKRFRGVARLIFMSFPGVKRLLFEVHSKREPSTMLAGIAHAKKIGPTGVKDLDLWEADFDLNIFGKNQERMETAKKTEGPYRKVVRV